MSGSSMSIRGDTIENSLIEHEFRFYGKTDAVLYVTFIVPTKTPADGNAGVGEEDVQCMWRTPLACQLLAAIIHEYPRLITKSGLRPMRVSAHTYTPSSSSCRMAAFAGCQKASHSEELRNSAKGLARSRSRLTSSGCS
jgi:hypothetical protein